MVPMGGEPTPSENAEFARALAAFAACGDSDDFSALTAFLDEHPACPWVGGLFTNLGLVYYQRGRYSRALQAFRDACTIALTITEQSQKPLADRAIAEYAYMLAKVGRADELDVLLRSVQHRGFTGTAKNRIAGARSGLAEMRAHPEACFRCGPLAVERIMSALNPGDARAAMIAETKSIALGCSLREVEQLTQRVGLNYRAAFREAGAEPVVPSVVHLSVDHFAALVRYAGGRYLLQDPTFRNDARLTRAALDAEASGYCLVPPGPLPDGWRQVDAAEAERVWGKGFTGTAPLPSGCNDPSTDACMSPCPGMAAARVYLLDVSLNLVDTPIGYSPPVGPAVPFTVRYSAKDVQFASNLTCSNFGPQWTFDWLSFIYDQSDQTYDPPTVTGAAGGPSGAVRPAPAHVDIAGGRDIPRAAVDPHPESGAAIRPHLVPQPDDAPAQGGALQGDVTYYMQGGGNRIFSGFDSTTQSFAHEVMDHTLLTITSPGSYEMRCPDGTVKVFGQSDGGITTPKLPHRGHRFRRQHRHLDL